MVGFTMESQGNDTLLVCQLEAEDKIDSFSKGMLQSNEIEGVLKPSFSQKNMDRYIKYPVTSKIPLKEFFRDEMKRADVLKVFQSLVQALEDADEYMLSRDHFLLTPESIFVNISSKKVSLVYLPVEDFSCEADLRGLILSLLTSVRYNLQEDLSYVAEIISLLKAIHPVAIDEEALRKYFIEKTNQNTKSGRPELLW